MIADDSPKRTPTLRPSYAPDVLIIRLEHVGLSLAAVRDGLTIAGLDSGALLPGATSERDVTVAGERVLCAPTTRHPRPGTRVRPHGSSRQVLTFRPEISYQTRPEAFMYGKISLATGAIGTGALLAGGMHMMTWLIVSGFAVVLGGLMLYRLATIKARR